MPRKLIQETQFCAPLSVYRTYLEVDEIWLEKYERYQKKSLRNRCIIMGVNGKLMLSVPLQKGKHQGLITDVRISYHDDWIPKMLHSIRSAYGTAPYFDYYYDNLSQIIRKKYDLLWDLNRSLLDFFISKVQIDTVIHGTTEYRKEYRPPDIDIRNYKMTDYLRPTDSYAAYSQVFEDRHGFMSNLSIIDGLFCLGPELGIYLRAD